MNKQYIFLFILFFCTQLLIEAQIKRDSIRVLNTVLIQANKPIPYIIATISDSLLSIKNIRDIGDLLRSTPNVSGVRKGGAGIDPVVRGFRYSQLNVILNNGVKVEGGCPNRMDPVTSHVEVEDIEKIEIIKGPYSLKYGSSMGGVINLVTKQPIFYNKFSVHTKALYGFESNWNGQRERVSVFGGNKNIYFNVAGGYKNYGSYKDGNENTINSSFMKYNYNGDLGICLKENHSILFSYYETHGRDVSYPSLPMDEKSDDTKIMSVDYHGQKISKIINFVDLKIYRSDVDHVMDNSRRSNYNTMQAVSVVDALNSGGRAEIGLNVGKHIFNIGADYEQIEKNGGKTTTMIMTMGGITTKSTKISNLWNDAFIQNTGLFAEYKTKFKSIDFTASIRADHNIASSDDTLQLVKSDIEYFKKNSSQFNNFSIGLNKKITKYITVGLAAGRGVRNANMLERYIKFLAVGYDNYDYLGNPQLKPEANHQVDLTIEYANTKYGSIYVNGFYSYVTNYITGQKLPPSVATPKTQGALGVKQFVNVDAVNLQGFECGYSSPERFKWGGTIIAAFTQATIPSTTKYIVQGGNVTGDEIIKNDPLPEIPPFETTLSIYYKMLKNKFTPKLICRVVAPQKRTSNAFYEPSSSGFALLNVALSYKLYSFATISVGIDNMLNHPYYEHLNRKIIGSTTKLYEPGRVFFINVEVNL